MQELLLIRGLPGTGKSTLAQKYAKKGYVHCEADSYHLDSKGVYRFDISEAPVAHAFCFLSAAVSLSTGLSVVVSNTFTRISEMLPYVRFAQKSRVAFRIIECKKIYGTLHGVPKETMAAMRARWERVTKISFQRKG